MSTYVFDESGWPVVLIQYPRETTNEAQRAYLDRVEVLLARREPFAMVVDVRGTKPLDVVQRRQLADWTRAHEAQLRATVRAAGIISDSVEVKGAARAVAWSAPPPYPRQEFATRDEAVAWAREHVKAP